MYLDIKEVYSGLGLLLTVVSAIYYYNLIRIGKVVPHGFTWTIWFVITAIAAFAQFTDGGGQGAWVTLLVAINCLVVALLGFYKKNYEYTRFDFICLIFSLLSVPLWLVTKTPLYSVLLVSLVDYIAFMPSYRVAWKDPYKDSALKFFMDSVKFIFAILALGNFSLVTLLYPINVIISNGSYALLLVIRRKMLKSNGRYR